MAKTKRNAMLIEEARKKVQTTQLMNRLHKCGMGEIKLEPTQVQSIKILLDKAVPNLQAVTVGNDPESGPLIFRWEG